MALCHGIMHLQCVTACTHYLCRKSSKEPAESHNKVHDNEVEADEAQGDEIESDDQAMPLLPSHAPHYAPTGNTSAYTSTICSKTHPTANLQGEAYRVQLQDGPKNAH